MMAELGALSVSVDTSQVKTATSAIGSLATKIENLAKAFDKLNSSASGIATAVSNIGSAAASAASSLTPMADGVAKINRHFTPARTQNITNFVKELQNLNDTAGKMPAVPTPSSGRGGGGGGRGSTSSGFEFLGMHARVRAGVAVTENAGFNPFAAGMLELGPAASAAAVAVGAVYGAVKAATSAVIDFGGAAIETGIRMQRLTSMLTVAAGGRPQAAAEFEYITDVSLRMGLNLEKATEGYAKFKVAANGAGLESAKTRAIFESVAKASTAMGLTTSDQSRVFLALEQMLSKGKVSAEELRRQLGNALPGSFTLMAKAAKTAGISVTGSTAELEKLMKAGKLISAEVLPAFAEEVEKAFGEGFRANADNLQANLNRMETGWGLFMKAVSEIGLMEMANYAVKGMAESIASLKEWLEKTMNTVEGRRLKEEFKDLGIAIRDSARELVTLITGTDPSKIDSVSDAIRSLRKAVDDLVPAVRDLHTTWKVLTFSFRSMNWAGSQVRGFLGYIKDGLTGADKDLKAFNERLAEVRAASVRATTFASSKLGMLTLGGSAVAPEINLSSGASAEESEVKRNGLLQKRDALLQKIQTYYAKEEKDIERLVSLELDRAGIVSAQERAHLGGLLRGIEESKAMTEAIKAENEERKKTLAIIKQVGEPKLLVPKKGLSLSPELQATMTAYEELDRKLGRIVGKKGTSQEMFMQAMNTYLEQGKMTAYQYNVILNDMEKKSDSLSNTLAEGMGGIFRSFADSAMDAFFETGSSFRDLVRDMLKQIAKLIFYYGVLLPLMEAAIGGTSWGAAIVRAMGGGKASGGSVTQATPYIVGERGPELFVPSRSGAIVPNHALSGGGRGPVTVYVNVTPTEVSSKTQDGGDKSRDAKLLGDRLGSAVRAIIVDELRPGGLIKETR
jgi:tape measure domain-containing protein